MTRQELQLELASLRLQVVLKGGHGTPADKALQKAIKAVERVTQLEFECAELRADIAARRGFEVLQRCANGAKQ